LRRNPDRYDLVYVSALRQEAYVALGAVRDRVPVALRAEASGRSGDCLWQLDAPCGRRIKRRAMKAAALVAPSALVQRELVAAGYPRDRIHHVAHGVPLPPSGGKGEKQLARATLAESHPAPSIPSWAPMAVYAGALHPSKGLASLIDAWKPIVARWPNAQLWLVGAGPDRVRLEAQIESTGLKSRVVPAGSFDSVMELLAAADLFVLPSLDGCMPVALLEAMAAGLPVVTTDIPGHRDLVTDDETGLLVPPGDPPALTGAISRLLDDPATAHRLGAAARNHAAEHFSLTRMVGQHVSLFEELVSPAPARSPAVVHAPSPAD
jgi:glycosyltransferase involved in cell wall biosynthesis